MVNWLQLICTFQHFHSAQTNLTMTTHSRTHPLVPVKALPGPTGRTLGLSCPRSLQAGFEPPTLPSSRLAPPTESQQRLDLSSFICVHSVHFKMISFTLLSFSSNCQHRLLVVYLNIILTNYSSHPSSMWRNWLKQMDVALITKSWRQTTGGSDFELLVINIATNLLMTVMGFYIRM